MSKLKEIIGYSRHNQQILKISDLTASLLLDKLHKVTFLDHNNRPYVFRKEEISEPESDALGETIVYENLSIDLGDIKEIFIMLTDDQRNIVMHIYYLYKNNKKTSEQNASGEITEDNPRIILQGAAGTGKSTIINLIEKLITWEENKTSDSPQTLKVLKCAFTGKAASNIDGLTLNHTFSIPIYNTKKLSKKKLDSKKESLQNCIFFICDEISMVGEKTMSTVNLRLQQIFDNNKLYGDRFVLLVGDLYQIDPVKQQPVYPNSIYWTCCEFYELTKIIRQRDETFINALNNFRDSQMTEKDVNLLKSREISDIDQVPDSVVHLFYQNKFVDEYNTMKLDKSNEKEEVVNAIEDSDNWVPSNLRVKIGIRYMITYNIDVGDSLANGTTGVAKDFDYDENGLVSVIWMEFNSNSIGKKTRSEYFNTHDKPGFENWVPIQQSKMVVTSKHLPKVSRVINNMFPLKAAEAITVHKSQGQTYHDGVCIHLTSDPYDRLCTNKSLQYVALTRVTKLEDLYIFGNFSFHIPNSKKFIRTENELIRLRNEKKLKLAYETFENKTGDVIIYLNTGSTFNEHYQFITHDKWYRNASLLIFSETNTVASDIIEIPNYELAYRSDDETVVRSGGGIICYKEASKSIKVMSSISNDENKIVLTLLQYEKDFFIITGTKGDLSDVDFKWGIDKFITKYIRDERCICFIGDYDNDPNKPFLAEYLINNGFTKELACDISTTDEANKCDLVYTRNFHIQQNHVGFYEYIPSSHKPIFVMLPPKAELIKKHSLVYPVDELEMHGSHNHRIHEAMDMD